jgi:hypothetical protein
MMRSFPVPEASDKLFIGVTQSSQLLTIAYSLTAILHLAQCEALIRIKTISDGTYKLSRIFPGRTTWVRK